MSKIGEGKGKPTLQSDLGKEFNNTEVKKVTEQYNYNHTFGLPGKPQGQGRFFIHYNNSVPTVLYKGALGF